MLKILELFGGIRACSKALERLGIDYECVDYVEIDKYAVKSANAIYGTNYKPQDITKWDKDVEVDLIMHGSPCQDFSLAGLGAGGDEGSGTRSSLMYETIRIVEKLQPKYVVWENVKNLLSDKHKHNFDNYLNTLVKLGYNNYYKVLNSKDYGIPQNRKRVFTISIRNDIDNGYKFPSPIELKYGIEKFLDKDIDKNLFKICPSMNKAVIDKKVKLINKNEICNCITTKKNRWNNEGFVLEENGEYRFFSNCERFKLMGFDEEDYLKASKVSPSLEIEKQAGNSIVVNVLEHIFKELFKERKEKKQRKERYEKMSIFDFIGK